MDIISGIIGYCILGALIAIAVGIAAFIGCVVFSAAANRRAWKDNLQTTEVTASQKCTCGYDNRIGRIHDPGCQLHPTWRRG